MHSSDYRFVRIREALIRNPAVVTQSFTESLEVVEKQPGYAYLSELDYLTSYTADKCDVVIVRSGEPGNCSREPFQSAEVHS